MLDRLFFVQERDGAAATVSIQLQGVNDEIFDTGLWGTRHFGISHLPAEIDYRMQKIRSMMDTGKSCL